jgi:hypothetical protein
MDIRLEHTDGHGLEAHIWLDGQLLRVCDKLSPPGGKTPPGLLEAVELTYFTGEGVSWERAGEENSGRRRELVPVRKWEYEGFGRVVGVAPVVIDFGCCRMEDPNWTTDRTLIGRYVRVPIDRLEIHTANRPDWPEEVRGGRGENRPRPGGMD